VLEAEDESGHLLGSMIRERNEEMRVIAENLMTNLMADLSQEAASHIEVGYPPVVILERAANWRTELIVVGRHGRGGLEAFLLGSVSKDVVQAAECDVLVV
jgi:nucleotide-binding universal stress UspA family protein